MKAPEQVPVSLNIVLALNCEAKPLIDRYRLKKMQAKGITWFHRAADEKQLFNINLVVSGIGLVNMVSACSWLAAKTEAESCAWLNVGTAGHANLPMGDLVRVVHSSDQMSDRSHYPPLVSKFAGTGVSLLTSSTPVTDYPSNQAVDMEASAFFATAKRFANSELVQSIKVISDNRDNDLQLLNAMKITKLMAAQIEQIDKFVDSLISLLPEPKLRFGMVDELQHLHCTASQMQQYQDLMGKLNNLPLEKGRLDEVIKNVSTVRDLLSALSELQLTTAPQL